MQASARPAMECTPASRTAATITASGRTFGHVTRIGRRLCEARRSLGAANVPRRVRTGALGRRPLGGVAGRPDSSEPVRASRHAVRPAASPRIPRVAGFDPVRSAQDSEISSQLCYVALAANRGAIICAKALLLAGVCGLASSTRVTRAARCVF